MIDQLRYGGIPTSPQPGRIGKALIRLFMKRARIADVVALTDQFHLVTLEGAELEGVQWSPGQKVQIAMGSAFVARTYTPIEWDPIEGRTRILGFAHGSAPGSDWLRSIRVDDECDLFGPRTSLDGSGLNGPVVLIGDETSMGLAYAMTRYDPAQTVTSVFEAGDVLAAEQVADHLGMTDFTIIQRETDDTHLTAMDAMLRDKAAEGHCFVLTGKAASVQRMRQGLKALGVSTSRVRTKAYWATGKSGLD